MNERVDRRIFGRRLKDASVATDSGTALQEFLRQNLLRDSVQPAGEDEVLIVVVTQRIDAVGGPSARQTELAQDLAELLMKAPTSGFVLDALELVAERQRIAQVIAKYLAGVITRTGFLSFISEQRWSTEVRQRVRELNGGQLGELLKALQSRDVRTLVSTFGR